MLDKEGLTQEVSVGVTYASLMSAVSLFFTGVVISQYTSFSLSIKVPLAFLIISTFSFIFAATIFSNAATELTLKKYKSVQRYMVYAKNIDELLGLYLFVLATPMVIGAVTHDSFVRLVTIIVAIVAFGLYSQSRFSILDDELTRRRKRLVTMLIVVLAIGLYYFQSSAHEHATLIYSSIAITLLGLLLLLAYIFCTRGKQYNITLFRAYDDDDAEEIAMIISKNLKHMKLKSLPEAYRENVRKLATSDAIRELVKTRVVTVAEFKGHVVGFAARQGNDIAYVSTDPELQRKGVGRQLVEYLEMEASEEGHRFATVTTNHIDQHFYAKVGYELQSESEGPTGNQYHMKKKLRR